MPPTLVDTHAHIHFEAFAGDVPGVLHRAGEAGIGKIVCVGVNTADSKKALELAQTYEHVWATVGIHPHDADELDQSLGYLRELAGRRKVVAIGECGLDLYRSETSIEQQSKTLRAQFDLAGELGRPLIFHVREAFNEFWPILNDYPETRGVVHSFTGSVTDMERAVKAGLHIALNGIVTYSQDAGLLEAARQVPTDRLILETDCPFLSPVPHRGKTNEPARVTDVADCVAKLRGETVEQLSATTTANAERLFGI